MTESTSASHPLVVVVGSVNLDIVTDVDHLPRAGETLIARSVRRNVGGKGANQAVAAQIACGDASFIGRVGDDAEGTLLVAELARRGVATDHVVVLPGEASGAAYIAVADGRNTIIVAAGANGCWDRLGIGERSVVAAARVVVCQLEVPDAVIGEAAEVGTGRFVLNAAPSRTVPAAVLAHCDPVVVNEHELSDLTAQTVDSPDTAIAAAHLLRDLGARSVVATLGAAGAIWVDADGTGRQHAAAVDVVDSTGAGDQFVGALAARLAIGDDLGGAVRWATAAASLSVQSTGTIDSYPALDAVDAAVRDLSTPRRG